MKNPQTIREMFSSIAPRYDLANQVLSFGIHKLWRKELVNWIANSHRNTEHSSNKPLRILDCATGTGDLAIEIKKNFKNRAHVTATDFCDDMLVTAPAKAQKKGCDIVFQSADTMNLPFADETFDVVTIAFGIRNVADPEKALAEMTRVLKPKGEIYILEFGQPKSPWFHKMYTVYSQKILPKIGSVVTGSKEAYQYLESSSAEFPCDSKFIELMQKSAPLTCLHARPLSMGIAYIYRATKAIFI
ncbi:MAG: bifunctional demethylmenaquinone methyltransferase/2-methoxy-6-polyprenyl-1,4-benzoquinol methylase UbiE [Proteobacteria bacterium]|nr:bifunctional demethylmenaquinone methyltransferase/2-methoxy-6-polyprenyl-1,4-benzoquinol methylase UbiE [Pseudomonadota bacterium]